MAIMDGLRQCRRFAAYYRERDNLGTHRCFYHPKFVNGPLEGTHPRGHYECCGRSMYDQSSKQGCTPCDHTSVTGHEPTYRVDTLHADLLQLAEGTNRIKDKNTGDLIILRVPKGTNYI